MWDYVERGRVTVPGWFDRQDALLFVAVDESHATASLTGDLLEIGAYMGRSAILLGHLRRSGERLVICDIFDVSPVATRTSASSGAFTEMCHARRSTTTSAAFTRARPMR